MLPGSSLHRLETLLSRPQSQAAPRRQTERLPPRALVVALLRMELRAPISSTPSVFWPYQALSPLFSFFEFETLAYIKGHKLLHPFQLLIYSLPCSNTCIV